jgi:hypothetical protein
MATTEMAIIAKVTLESEATAAVALPRLDSRPQIPEPD